MVIVALGLGAATGDSDPEPTKAPASGQPAALNVTAPPRADVDALPCSKVLPQLPVNLGQLRARIVYTKPETPFVVAWGDPAVVFRCGAARPASLKVGSTVQDFSVTGRSGPYFAVTDSDDGKVFTTVDRAAYISVTVPTQYGGGPLSPIAKAIATGLPTAVCTTDSATPDITKLCTRRP